MRRRMIRRRGRAGRRRRVSRGRRRKTYSARPLRVGFRM